MRIEKTYDEPTLVLVLTAEQAEFLADCVERAFPRDNATKELRELAERARQNFVYSDETEATP